MAKSSFTHASYYYGMPDMYMQMGYFPFPSQRASEAAASNVLVPYAMSMSMQCSYYLGQTEKLDMSSGTQGYTALVNPVRSNMQLYINDWYVSNFSDRPVEMQLWFGQASAVTGAKTSTHITSGFVQPSPCPASQGQIVYSSSGSSPLADGVIASTRILPPMTTISAEKNGRWILAPGTAMSFLFPQAERQAGQVLSAIGWWEQPLFR